MPDQQFPNGHYPPTSECLGLMNAGLEEAVSAHRSVGQWAVLSLSVRSFEQLFDALPLTNRGIGRAVFVPLGPDWLLYLNNWVGGTDPVSVCAIVATRLRCRTVKVVLAERKRPFWPACSFETHSGARVTSHVLWERLIGARNDGGRWKFDLEGDPFPFEEFEAYTRSKVRDRFTPEMLFRYLGALGVPPVTEQNLDFTRAVFLENLEMTPEARVTLAPAVTG
jgi:hypothetical protein